MKSFIPMTTSRTLRRLVSTYQDNQDLFDWLFDKHTSCISHEAKKWTSEERMLQRESCMLAYVQVIRELLSKKRVKAGSMPICVRWTQNYGETERYLDVTFKNLKYTPPPKGLKPWGGRAPKGYYNCNAEKYNEHFAFGYTSWNKIIDTPVIIDTYEKISDVEILGAILWELTFNGFSEKESNAFIKKLNKTLNERMRDIKKDL